MILRVIPSLFVLSSLVLDTLGTPKAKHTKYTEHTIRMKLGHRHRVRVLIYNN